MLNRNGKFIGLSIILLTLLSAIPISAKINVGPINSCSARNEPIIDGKLEKKE